MDDELQRRSHRPRSLAVLASPSAASGVPAGDTHANTDVHAPRSLTLDVGTFAWSALEAESAHQGVSVEELVRFSILYYLADSDSGRIARRLPPPTAATEVTQRPPGATQETRESRLRSELGTELNGKEPTMDADDGSVAAQASAQLIRDSPDSPTFTFGTSRVDAHYRAGGSHDAIEAYRRRVASVAAARQRFRRRRSAGSVGRPRVSVIIPTLNEALNLPLVLCELPACVDEVVIVDGLSTDGTPEVASEMLPDAKIVYQTERGKGNALRCGFEAATGDILVMMDADGSADPSEIPAFVAALLDGADFAKGTRFHPDGGSSDITRLRAAGNLILSGSVNLLFRTEYSDLCYGYNAFWRHCLPAMSVDCTGFEVETLINIRIARAGLVVREVPSFEWSRIHGQSNLRTFRDGGRVMRTILRERLRRLPHLNHEDSAIDRLGAPIVEAGLLSSTPE